MGSKSKNVSKERLKDKLEGNELDLSLSNLTKVPVNEIASLTKATAVDLSCNQLTVIPENFCMITRIVKLDLSKNALASLPSQFGLLTNLRHVDLLGNKLQRLPSSFADLENLKWLDLKNNPLEVPPLKLAGDCLDDKQCKLCAQRVLRYMGDLKVIENRKNEERLEEERVKEVAVEEKRLAKEQKQKALKKRQKLEDKERRRAEYLVQKAIEEQKEADNMEGDVSADTTDLTDEFPVANGISSQSSETQPDSYTSLVMFFAFFILFFGVFVGSYIHCQEYGEHPLCQQFNGYVNPIRDQIKLWIKNF